MSQYVDDRDNQENFEIEGPRIRLRKIFKEENGIKKKLEWQRIMLNKGIRDKEVINFIVEIVEGYAFMIGLMRENSPIIQDPSNED